MARRASSGVNSQALIIGVVILVLILGAGYWLLNRPSSDFDAPELDMEQAMGNSRSLSGNRYKVTGKLIERRVESVGQVVTIHVGEESDPKPLSIIIPDGFKGGNLTNQTDYIFLIEFNTIGMAVAEDVKQL